VVFHGNIITDPGRDQGDHQNSGKNNGDPVANVFFYECVLIKFRLHGCQQDTCHKFKDTEKRIRIEENRLELILYHGRIKQDGSHKNDHDDLGFIGYLFGYLLKQRIDKITHQETGDEPCHAIMGIIEQRMKVGLDPEKFHGSQHEFIFKRKTYAGIDL
jgi:hypothetical protein